MQYSEKFKEQMVKRMVGPGAVSATALSREVGVAQPTLSKWLRASLAAVNKDQQAGTGGGPWRDRAPEEKAAQRHDLLEILEDRDGRASTVVTSQLPVSKWYEWIDDPTLADAILDRLVHAAYKVDLKGESGRKNRGNRD